MSERQQLLQQTHAYLGRPCPTVGDQLLDHLAFALMWLAALIEWRIWTCSKCHLETRFVDPDWRSLPCIPVAEDRFEVGGIRFCRITAEWWDGWRPGRYL